MSNSSITTDAALDFDSPTPSVGEFLREEYMAPLGLSQRALAQALGVTPPRIGRLVNGETPLSADMALRLAKAFRTTPQFWLNIQLLHDLSTQAAAGGGYDRIKPLVA